MNIYDQVEDLHMFLKENGIDEKVTLVGHSLGGKIAMAYSLIYPERVEALCSIDSPPVNRNDFPYLNKQTLNLISQACSYLPGIEERSFKEAWQWLKSKREENKILVSSLMMNLDKASIDQARLLINVRGLAARSSDIFDFPIFEDSQVNSNLGPENLLFINGANSM
jgi:pimeloyl-ACP methyl ester carboxylesterase